MQSQFPPKTTEPVMPATMRFLTIILLLLSANSLLLAQSKSLYQTDFPPEEFAERRAQIFDTIGDNAIAIVQGASYVDGFKVFRQSNQFYYLSGIEVPSAYLLLDGRSRKTTLYLPHADAGRERGDGEMLTAKDEDEVKQLSGIDHVYGVH